MVLLRWGVFQQNLHTLWRFDAPILAWLTIGVATAIHEFAHATTCKRFGGQVREMGFMLIYFQPALYGNVSDAWLFPRRNQRLWVSFAGAYADMIVAALATFAWTVADPQTWLHHVAMLVMLTLGLRTLFNLNPLIKLDGYYMLSDALEIPNLRQRSLAYLGMRLRRLMGIVSEEVPRATRRERWIYVIYGILAGAYSCWLLSVIARRFGTFLIGRYHGLGVALFVGFLALLLAAPLKGLATSALKLLGRPRRPPRA